MTMAGGATRLLNAVPSSSPAAGRRSLGEQPRYGMAMRFEVIVSGGTGPRSLGSWSGCSGLAVSFKFEELQEGGNYEYVEQFPGEVKYGQVTLERAIEANSSASVKDWLQSVVADWINADEAGSRKNKRYAGSDISIKLFGAYGGKPVYEWTLRKAVPVSWSGPTLSSKAGDVAIERLTLAHEGFLKTSASADQAANPNYGKLKLTLKDIPSEPVIFQYNPARVTLEKTVQIRNSSFVARTIEQQVTDPGKLSVRFGDLWIEGKSEVQMKVATLLDWLEPAPAKTNSTLVSAKKLRVTMGVGGAGLSRVVVLKAVNITYTRFTKTGVPNRAKVNLTLEEVIEQPKGTNPTSGTPEPSRVQTVVAGDSLPNLAQSTYGNPAQWRGIAEANGIDDPLRLRTGRVLNLPDAG